MPPRSLYLHFPWCLKRCPYCDFNAWASPAGQIPQGAYRERMLAEIDRLAGRLDDGPAPSTLFIGGGTPSLLDPRHLADLLQACRRHLALSAEAEITLEVNPGTAECGDPEAWMRSGVNRLSLGVQSFDDEQLRTLGRIHSSAEAEEVVRSAVRSGCEHVNLDLMYALPGQTPAGALADLERALETGVGHLSWYQLTLEPNTPFFTDPPSLPDEEVIEQIEQQGAELLGAAGFVRYEVSAWARPGQQCRHNLNYWTFGDYFGLGPGAHSKASSPQGVSRWAQIRRPQAWLDALDADTGHRLLDESDLVFEFFLNSLRLYPGPDAELFEQRTGLKLEHPAVAAPLARARQLGLLPPDSLHPTAPGRRHLDELTEIFLPPLRVAGTRVRSPAGRP